MNIPDDHSAILMIFRLKLCHNDISYELTLDCTHFWVTTDFFLLILMRVTVSMVFPIPVDVPNTDDRR